MLLPLNRKPLSCPSLPHPRYRNAACSPAAAVERLDCYPREYLREVAGDDHVTLLDAVGQCHQIAIRGAQCDHALFDKIALADDVQLAGAQRHVQSPGQTCDPARIRSKTHRKPHRSLDAIAAGEAGGGEGLAVQGAAGPAIGCAQAEFGAETLRRKRRVEA